MKQRRRWWNTFVGFILLVATTLATTTTATDVASPPQQHRLQQQQQEESTDNIFDNTNPNAGGNNNNNNNNENSVESKCTLCTNGAVMQLPNNVPITDGLLAGQSCAQLDQWIGLLFVESSPECQTIQSLGTMCGCPLVRDDDNDDDDDDSLPCTLCPDRGPVNNPHNPLPVIVDLAIFVETIGTAPTCAMFQAYLLSSSTSKDGLCLLAHEYMANYCGCNDDNNESTFTEDTELVQPPAQCSICPTTTTTPIDSSEDHQTIAMMHPNKTLNMDGFPFQTCQDLQDAAGMLLLEGSSQCESLKLFGHYCGCSILEEEEEEPRTPCTMCPDGTPVPFPDRPYPRLKDIFGGFVPTCAVVESSLMVGTERGSDQCDALQLFASYCGCPARENHCVYCAGMDNVPPSYANQTLDLFATYFGAEHGSGGAVTCSEAWYTQYQMPSGDNLCFLARRGSFLCGCNGGENMYANANTKTQKFFLAWIPRVSGGLSILVSAFAPLFSLLCFFG